ncbi:hypothetical protein BH10BAC1_BH10BAC1_07650 [soil metagenome]
MSFLKKISLNTYLLLFVIAVATTIRFWDFSSMQFMHDELSAIIRSQANSFSELIYKTKTTDVHPVLVPIFVHYWTLFIGTSEIAVRFPFILCGLASIYYAYKIAKKWFNPTVAILTCAFLATLQFPTMYGQLERPYATGMLFSVLTVWCWTQFFFGEKSKNKYAIGFVVFASLCTYNHYFSLLFAAMVGATGLLFINKANAKKYILMCLSVLILFIPHVSILLFHLSMGSGEENNWIGKPQADWLLTFLKYLFHYSYLVYSLLVVLILMSFYFRKKEKKGIDKMRIVALVWALLVPTLAYLFSVFKSPVLQFSTFTFSLPFLLMFIFSFYGELKTAVKIGLVAIIILVNTYTLFADRKHDPVFYKHPYEEMARISDKAIAAFGENRVSVAHATMEGFVDFYFKKLGASFKYLRVDKPDTKVFLNYLENERTEYFVAGNLPLEYYQLIKERYPYVISKNEGFTFTVYCFSKIKPKEEIKEHVLFSENQSEFLSYGNKNQHWEKVSNTSEAAAYPGITYMRIDSTEEYSPGFSAKLSDVIKSKHSILNVSAEISTGNVSSNPTLVVSIDEDGKSLLWRGSEYQNYQTKKMFFNTVYVSNLFSGFDLEKHPNATIKIYIWNRDKKVALVHNFKVEVIESNPLVYGLYEPIE